MEWDIAGGRPPTEAEATFLAALDPPAALGRRAWLHQDAEGPWLLLVLALPERHAGVALRLDFDGAGLRGGWNPQHLIGGEPQRALESEVAFHGPSGLDLAGAEPRALARVASDWLHQEYADAEARRDYVPPSWVAPGVLVRILADDESPHDEHHGKLGIVVTYLVTDGVLLSYGEHRESGIFAAEMLEPDPALSPDEQGLAAALPAEWAAFRERKERDTSHDVHGTLS
ncbi:hypothetical protein [Motilibacter deserti]|uniref:Uncharacterized protein n=1 Tax=Motilibacter deserti TaxID=2714956 RepID=A0ABX0H0E1_9ACTN|nr:hypothetical protein [Motilibacter deserti]NHC15450.1 hypothetical protein [Motilibacter deserti]